jgi:hypothetical protein
MPPWCPSCGGDLKKVEAAPPPQPADRPGAPAPPNGGSAAAEQLPGGTTKPRSSGQCSSCQREVGVKPDGRLPPWCPFCGGDLKKVEAGPTPPQPAGSAPAPALDDLPATRSEVVEDFPVPGQLPRTSDDLGPPQQVYRSSRWRRTVCLICALFCFAFAGLMGCVYAERIGKNSQSAVYLAGLALVGGAVGLYLALSMAKLSYLVFADAFVQKRGSQATIIRWEEVREVYETFHVDGRSFRVVAHQGIDIELTANTRGHIELGQRIERELMERRWPEFQAELDRGGTVWFGPVGYSHNALHLETATSPWRQTTTAIRLDPDRQQKGSANFSNFLYLFIYTQVQTKALKFEIDKIPNFGLFLELVRWEWPQCLPAES